MDMATLLFIAVLTFFLAAVFISAARINVISELEDIDAPDSGARQAEPWNLSGVTEPSGDTIDGEK